MERVYWKKNEFEIQPLKQLYFSDKKKKQPLNYLLSGQNSHAMKY